MTTYIQTPSGVSMRFIHHVLFSFMLVAGGSVISPSATAQTPSAASHTSTMMKGDMPMDMHGSMKNMQERMDSMKLSGDIDYDFAAMMRVHHQGAVDMAEMELEKGQDPEMKQMAKNIIAAQKKEISKFDKWLAAHKKETR